MFTGLVESTGTLRRRVGSPVARAAFETTLGPLSPGESIAVDGVCLTVDRVTERGFEADLSSETLARTTLGSLAFPCPVHLERATPLGGRMGGHIVLGHVDGVGHVVELVRLGGAARLAVRAPADLARYLAEKGCIAVSGVSLTLNGVADDPDGKAVFDVMLVPHTLEKTALGQLRPGSPVNLEVDVLARYVARQHELGPPKGGPGRVEGTGRTDDDHDARLVAKLAHGGFL